MAKKSSLQAKDMVERPSYSKKNEDRYRNLFYNNHTVMLVINPESGEIIDSNPAAEKFYGWSSAELIGKNISDINTLSDEEVKKEMALAKSENRNHFDFKHQLKNGKIRDVEVYSGPVLIDEKQYLYSFVYDVTEKKLAEKALSESETKLKTLTESTKSIFWEFDFLNNKWTYISPQVNSVLGFPVEYWKNLDSWASRIHIEDKKQSVEYCQHKTAKGEDHDLEYRFIKPDGSIIWIKEEVKVIMENDAPVSLQGFMIDITHRKNTEVRLKESEQKFQALFKNLSVGVSLINPQMQVLESNPQLQKWFTGKEITNNPFCYCVFSLNPQNQPCKDCPVLKTFKDGKTYEIEKQSKTLLGDKYFRIVSTPVINEQGKVTAVVEMMDDITQRKLAEMSLRESEEKYRKLFETMEQGVIYHDINGYVTSANPTAQRILGLTIGQLQDIDSQYPNWKAIHEDGSVFPKEEYPATISLKSGKSVSNILMGVFNLNENDFRWIIVNAIPEFKNGSKKPYRVYTTFTDITERKKSEEEIKQNAERLKALLRIFEFKADNIQGLLDFALEEALKLTASIFGYIYFYDEEKKQFTLNSWSKNVLNVCSISDKKTIYNLGQTGLWGETVRQRKEIVINDYQSLPKFKKGYPKGHVELKRFMSIPIIINDKIVAVVGVANKIKDYNDTDINQLKLLMSSVWGLVQRNEDSLKIAKLSAAVDQSSASIVITNIKGVIEYVNPKFSQITGYSFDESIGCNPRILNSGFHNKSFFENMWETILSGKDWKGQIVNKKKNGELYWESASISPIRNAHGDIINFIAIKDDITDLKHTEEALRESELKLRRMIEQSPDGIMLTDENATIVAWNKAMETIYNIPSNAVIGTKIWELHSLLSSGNDNHSITNYIYDLSQEILKKGECPKFKLNTIHEIKTTVNNSQRYIQLIVFVIPSEKGNMLASFVRDITNQKQSELAIKESEEKLRAIFDNSLQSFVILSTNLEIQAFNYFAYVRAKEFFDVEIHEGFSLYKTKFKQINENYISRLQLALQGKIYSTEVRLVNKTGEISWHEMHISPIFNNSQEIIGVFFNSIDVTERKKAEESMAHSLEKERELGELKSRFISTVSHEFRTPLASIFSNTQLLQRYVEKWDEQKKNSSLQRILDSVKAMTTMLDDVSLIGKEQNGKMTFKPEITDLYKFTTQICEEAEHSLNTQNRINLTISESLKTVLIDKTLIRHIIINLLTNALKYSETKVFFSISKTDKSIDFQIEDSGIGIPVDEIQYIFDPFFRASNSENYKGTGLGMSIVSQCVKTHGGEIHVGSAIGKGTKVNVRVPLRRMM